MRLRRFPGLERGFGRSPSLRLKAVLAGAAIAAVGALNIAPHLDIFRVNYDVKITGSERVVDSSEDGTTSRYVVFTKDAKTGEPRAFENTDSLVECLFDGCKFDSSTLQTQLMDAKEERKTCTVRAYGWRVPFLSGYENIVKADCE